MVEPEADRVDHVLQMVSKRQRQICLWLLEQPTPVSSLDIDREFKVSKRQAYRLISNTLQRISGASQ